MRKIIILSTAALVILALSISCNNAPDEQGMTLSGRVTESDTTIYLGGVVVSDGVVSDTTDERGFFELNEISKENHSVTFEKDGYTPTSIDIQYIGTLDRPKISRLIVLEKIDGGQ